MVDIVKPAPRRGGRGDVSRSLEANRTERNVALACGLAKEEFDYDYMGSITWQSRIYAHEVFGGEKDYVPDGGVFKFKGKVALVVEAKKQNDRGNAFERYQDLKNVVQLINPKAMHIVFASGEGAVEGGQIWKTAKPHYMCRETNRVLMNTINVHRPSIFLSRNPAPVEEIYHTIVEAMELYIFHDRKSLR